MTPFCRTWRADFIPAWIQLVTPKIERSNGQVSGISRASFGHVRASNGHRQRPRAKLGAPCAFRGRFGLALRCPSLALYLAARWPRLAPFLASKQRRAATVARAWVKPQRAMNTARAPRVRSMSLCSLRQKKAQPEFLKAGRTIREGGARMPVQTGPQEARGFESWQ